MRLFIPLFHLGMELLNHRKYYKDAGLADLLPISDRALGYDRLMQTDVGHVFTTFFETDYFTRDRGGWLGGGN